MKLILPFFLPSMLLLGFFATPSVGPVNIDLAAFPEPLAIFLIGFALMAIASASRRLIGK